tara:strand:- start:18 stop:983 length:966 start_codon:yes stop_codon:yes gene_type:complete
MKSSILSIAGDASFRKFYRLVSKGNSKIIVIAQKEKYKNLVAYSTINKFLRTKKIFTPKLYAYNFSKGIMILEDFGDLTFYKKLIKTKNKFLIYKNLVNLLIKIQKIKPKFRIKNISKGSYKIKKYSNDLLFKETDLFFDWYLPLFLGKKKSIYLKKKNKKVLRNLYNRLNFSNSYFVHRDYHAQNLMKVGSQIGVLDSQDAVIGNPAYDLVSLIDDVRIKTSQKLKNQIYNYYLKKNSKIYGNNEEKFLEDFNILSVQRSLKIIGIFSRLFKRDKKKQYLKFIPYTWKLLEMRMKTRIFYDLKKILDTNIPKRFRKKMLY